MRHFVLQSMWEEMKKILLQGIFQIQEESRNLDM